MLHDDAATANPCDDTAITLTGITDDMIERANQDLMDEIRNNAELTDADLADLYEATVTVRPHPDYRDVTAPATDALGQVPPESAADLLELLDREVGRTACFVVDLAGRVFVTRRIDGSEAIRIGSLIARHLEANCGLVGDVRVDMERTPDGWRPWLCEGGRRRRIEHLVGGSEAVAREWAESFRLGHCPTVVTAAEVEVMEGRAA